MSERLYLIQEFEMKDLDSLAFHASVWRTGWNIGCFLLGMMVPNVVRGDPKACLGAYLCALLTAGCFWLSTFYRRRRKARLRKILSECQQCQ